MLKIRRFKKKLVNEGLLDDLESTTQSASTIIATSSYNKHMIQEFFDGDDSFADNDEIKNILNYIWSTGRISESLINMNITVTNDAALKILNDYYPGDKEADAEKYLNFLSDFSNVIKSSQMFAFSLRKIDDKEMYYNGIKRIFDKQLNIDFSDYYQGNCDYFFKIYKYIVKNFEYFKNISSWMLFFVELSTVGLDAGTIRIHTKPSNTYDLYMKKLFPEFFKKEMYDAHINILSRVQDFRDIPYFKNSLAYIMYCDLSFQLKQIANKKFFNK